MHFKEQRKDSTDKNFFLISCFQLTLIELNPYNDVDLLRMKSKAVMVDDYSVDNFLGSSLHHHLGTGTVVNNWSAWDYSLLMNSVP